MTTDKTIKSKYLPKQTNVTWVDLSGETPIEKHFVNGRWIAVSGGGAGSSNPTEADATKIWLVTPVQKGTKTEEIVIVPEQTLIGDQELEYNDKFVLGAQCVAVINDVEYRGEVVEGDGGYLFGTEFYEFTCNSSVGSFYFYNYSDSREVTASLSIIEETPIYDYNWAPGVKIPIPTAEDEGKILVVTKVEGDNTSIIVPEQEVPADQNTPLTDVDLTKFVVGNTVKVTVTYGEEQSGEFNGSGTRGAKSANSETFTATGVIEDEGETVVVFDPTGITLEIWQTPDNLLCTNAVSTVYSALTIKLEYVESNYEYQLQENSGGENTSVKSNIFPFIALARFATEEEQTKYNLVDETYVLDYPKELTIPPYAVITSNINYSSEWTVSNNRIVFNRYGSEYEDDILTVFNLENFRFVRLQYDGQWCDLFKAN